MTGVRGLLSLQQDKRLDIHSTSTTQTTRRDHRTQLTASPPPHYKAADLERVREGEGPSQTSHVLDISMLKK